MLDEGTGIERRKKVHRSPQERAAIVAQSYEAGQTVAGVARRHGIAPSQLSGWRSAARARESGSSEGSQFAEVAIMPDLVVSPPATRDGVKIAVGIVVVGSVAKFCCLMGRQDSVSNGFLIFNASTQS
jgi:hypothetical protein